jgi:Ankyrin repeats (3 copies)
LSITGVFNTMLDKVGLYPPPWAVEELTLCLRIDGKEAELRKLLAKYPDAVKWQAAGMQPLEKALWHGNFPAAKALVEADPSILLPSWKLDDNTPLRDAVKRQCAESLTALVKLGANIGETDNTGNTLLHHIAMTGDKPAIVDLLVSLGADPAAKNDKGDTPLMRAARSGRLIEAFYAHDSNLAQRDTHGKTLVMMALDGEAAAAAITTLATLGADLDATRPSDGSTALTQAASAGNIKAAAALLLAGATCEQQNPWVNSLRQQAAAKGETLFEKLLSESAEEREARKKARAEELRGRRQKILQEEVSSCTEGLDGALKVKTIRLKPRKP